MRTRISPATRCTGWPRSRTSGSRGYGTHGYAYDLAGNIRRKGPPGAAGELALHDDRTPGQPTHVAAVDLRVADGQWLANAGLYGAYAECIASRGSTAIAIIGMRHTGPCRQAVISPR